MEKGIIFIAGSYGVGKSTLCKKLEEILNISSFSAGDLISEINGEIYGKNKVVKNKTVNQNILIDEAKTKLLNTPTFILAGHFCIFNVANEVEILPEFVYKELPISKIILLETEPDRVLQNIKNRDDKTYAKETVVKLIETEHEQAIRNSYVLGIPLFIHKMKFDETDVAKIANIIQGCDT